MQGRQPSTLGSGSRCSEATGTLTALAAAWAAHAASGSLATAAAAGAVGESVGYYGCMAAPEGLRHHAHHRQDRAGGGCG